MPAAFSAAAPAVTGYCTGEGVFGFRLQSLEQAFIDIARAGAVPFRPRLRRAPPPAPLDTIQVGTFAY